MDEVEQAIKILAARYSKALAQKIVDRTQEMKDDDVSHNLLYQVLRLPEEEGRLIDLYQNKGRFVYKYAGSFLEDAALLCFLFKFPEAQKKVRIPNSLGSRPKTFEIDCLVAQNAFELKWRDATTDGDHITKEHSRIKVIEAAGYKPVRVMFYRPNRLQARKIQDTLQTLYGAVNGEYYVGDAAWNFIKAYTHIDLKRVLENIAEQNLAEGELQNDADIR